MAGGYDTSTSIFSPDGKIFQIEYAAKAIENSCTCVVLKGKNGVLFGVEKSIPTLLLKKTTNTRISTIDEHIGFISSGFYPDARALFAQGIEEASDYFTEYRQKISCKELAERVGQYVHAYTLYGAFRPFGCVVFLSSWDKRRGPQLYGVDPSGVVLGYKGWAVGKNHLTAKSEIEKLNCAEKTVEELVKEAMRILLNARDVTEEKYFIIEMSWVSEETRGQHKMVPADLIKSAEDWAKIHLEESEDSD